MPRRPPSREDGTNSERWSFTAYQQAALNGAAGNKATWAGLMQEVVYNALALTDMDDLRDQLTAVKGLTDAWIADLDGRVNARRYEQEPLSTLDGELVFA